MSDFWSLPSTFLTEHSPQVIFPRTQGYFTEMRLDPIVMKYKLCFWSTLTTPALYFKTVEWLINSSLPGYWPSSFTTSQPSVFVRTKSLIDCDRATYSKLKLYKAISPCSVGTHIIRHTQNSNYKSNYLFDIDWVLEVFFSVKPRKVCIYVAINRHLDWRAGVQPPTFTIIASPLSVLAYPQNFLILHLIEVMVECSALVNSKGYIWTVVACNIHQNYNNWCIFLLVLVLWRLSLSYVPKGSCTSGGVVLVLK